MPWTWNDDPEIQERLKKRSALFSQLNVPEVQSTPGVNPVRQDLAKPEKTYHPDSIGAFVQNGGVRETISGPFVKQNPDGSFRNANMNEMSSMFDPSFKGKTVDVWKGNQLSRYGYDENVGMAPLALSKQEQAENRMSRDNMLMSAALNATPNETVSKHWDPKTGRLTGKSSTYTSNVPGMLSQITGFRIPELQQEASQYRDDTSLKSSRERNDALLKQEMMQQGGLNYRERLSQGSQNFRSSLKTDEPPAIGTVNQVGKIIAGKYLPLAKVNLQDNLGEQQAIVEALNSNDMLGSGLNDSRLRNALNDTQRGSYDWVRMRAEKYSSQMSPANAVDQALKDYRKAFPDQFKPKQNATTDLANIGQSARNAIAKGADKNAVKMRLKKMGFTEQQLTTDPYWKGMF